jgi:hypothetical protein
MSQFITVLTEVFVVILTVNLGVTLTNSASREFKSSLELFYIDSRFDNVGQLHIF